jgi:2-succinyl-5-enolpyruvyl-6-hydroxy-3-cyclohexene-1-carboxylate synthase
VAASSRIAVVSSSMPIRDIEWFSPTGDGLLVYANRGANGIDGVMATAIGVASELGNVTVFLGDVAFLHDASSLAMLASRDMNVRVVVTNNDGGGIFSFLPQANAVSDHRFEQLFGTPHGTDVGAVARAFGLVVHEPKTYEELLAALSYTGTSVTVVNTDRRANVTLHGRLHEAIAGAVDAAAFDDPS